MKASDVHLRGERAAVDRSSVLLRSPRQLAHRPGSAVSRQIRCRRESILASAVGPITPGPLAVLNSACVQPVQPPADICGRSLVAHAAAQQRKAYMEMARPINFLPSALLVLIGACTGTGRPPLLVLRSATVWVVSLLASSVSAASMMVNDYFDWRSGVDTLNSPQKPLPSGLIPPDGALLASFSLYIAVLVAACFMAQPLLRTVIALSAAMTLLYTPLLKKTTGIKNATVAAVITASPLAGALAAAGSSGTLLVAKLLPLCAFIFLGIMYREVLMDITDEAGDRAAGVRTIPVVAGRSTALTVASLFIICAGTLLVYGALHGQGLVWAWSMHNISETLVRAAALAAAVAVAQPVAASVLSIWQQDFDKNVVSTAIDASIKAIGLGMILLAAFI